MESSAYGIKWWMEILDTDARSEVIRIYLHCMK